VGEALEGVGGRDRKGFSSCEVLDQRPRCQSRIQPRLARRLPPNDSILL